MDCLKNRFDEAVGFVTPVLRRRLSQLPESIKNRVAEIRLRNEGPVVLTDICGQALFIHEDGLIANTVGDRPVICSHDELCECVRILCGYSVHTHQQELINGFISLRGGHRAGIAGCAVIDGKRVVSVKNISSVNIRVAREIRGAADMLMRFFRSGPKGLLIAGPPSSGKTTVLRDLIRQLSNGSVGHYFRVLAADERGELAAMWNGRPFNDIGCNCDVICGYSKAEAVSMGVRSLSPEIVVCDEIGTDEESKALRNALSCGVTAVASIHASSREELLGRKWVVELLESGVFERVVLLESRSCIKEIIRVGELVDKAGRNNHDDCGRSGSGDIVFSKAETSLPTA